MTPIRAVRRRRPSRKAPQITRVNRQDQAKELVIVTGISGAGKASALKAFEDLGYHAVDNLPLELLPDFAALVGKSHRDRERGHRGRCARGPDARSSSGDSQACEDGAAHARGLSGRAGRRAGAALLRDAAAASAAAARRRCRARSSKSGNCWIRFATSPTR